MQEVSLGASTYRTADEANSNCVQQEGQSSVCQVGHRPEFLYPSCNLCFKRERCAEPVADMLRVEMQALSCGHWVPPSQVGGGG